jgi:hypothetical protein
MTFPGAIQEGITERLRRGDPGVLEGWGYTDNGTHYYRARASLCRAWRWGHGGLFPDTGITEPGDCPTCTKRLALEAHRTVQDAR